MTEVRVRGSRRRKVGPHREPPRHPRSGSTSTTSCVTIAKTVNLESYDGSKRNQSASSSLCQVPDVPRSRFPTLGSVPGQALPPTTAREGLALARQRALLPSRVDCDLGKPSILACGRGIITRSGRYEAGGSFALQGIRSLLDWRSGTEFLSISLPSRVFVGFLSPILCVVYQAAAVEAATDNCRRVVRNLVCIPLRRVTQNVRHLPRASPSARRRHHPGCRCFSRVESPALRPPYAASMPYLRVNHHTPVVGRRDESRNSLSMASNTV